MKDIYGNSSKNHDPFELAKSFFTMSNDAFYELYGFNWVPPEPIYSMVKNKLDEEKRIKLENRLNNLVLQPMKRR